MRILFLDDDQERHDAFRKRMPAPLEIVSVYTVAQAKESLDRNNPFLEAHLDHDLADYGPRDMYGYRDEYTGQHVAHYIARMPAEKRPNLVRIHSWNPDGARAMHEILQGAGVRVFRRPFSFGCDR